MKTKILQFALGLVLLFSLGCSKDNTEPSSLQDPEGTVMVDMISSDEKIEGIIYNDGGNFKGALFLPLGSIHGLSEIESIPRSGWVAQSAIIEGHGYLAWKYGQYYRIYVLKKDGTQVLVKYQSPFYGSEKQILTEKINITFGNNQESEKLTFKNSNLFPFTVVSSKNWCRVGVSSSNENTPYDAISISVEDNPTPEKRECVVAIKNNNGELKDLNIVQEGTDSWVLVEKSQVEVESNAGTSQIHISSNTEWSAESNSNWCNVEQESSQLSIIIDENLTDKPRTAIITVTTKDKKDSKKITVIQSIPSFNLSVTTMELEGLSMSDSFLVLSKASIWEVTSDQTWCTVQKGDNSSVVVSVEDNHSGAQREAIVTVSMHSQKESVRIIQKVLQPDQIIYYTSNQLIQPNPDAFEATIRVNKYEDGMGMIVFDKIIEKIGRYAFEGCPIFTIQIPNSITLIESGAFYNCVTLESFVISDNIKEIGYHAFYGCSTLKSLIIPKTVLSIGEEAFAECTGLSKIDILGNLTYGNKAFDKCTGELYINCSRIPDATYNVSRQKWDNAPFLGASFSKIIFGQSVNYIGKNSFRDCQNMPSIHIPSNVRQIGDNAFYGCTGYLYVNCNIGDGDFSSSLFNQVVIGDNVSTIGKSAFGNCTNLQSIKIGQGVTTIGYDAFYKCTGTLIINCNIPPSTSLYADGFNGAEFDKIIFGENVTTIGDKAFAYCTKIKTIEWGDSITFIGDDAFYYCSQLTSINLPRNVKTIGQSAFAGSPNTTQVSIPSSVQSIGYHAFAGCTGELFVDCETVPSGAFNSSSFTTITFGQNVRILNYSTGTGAFEDINQLQTIYCKSVLPPKIGLYEFFQCPNLSAIYVPVASVDTYKSAWVNKKNLIFGYID